MQTSFPVFEFHINGIIYLRSHFCVDSFDQHYVHKIHLSIVCNWSSFISISVFYFINALQLTYLFYCWWDLGLFLVGGYYKQHCYEHSCAYVLNRCLWASGGQQFSEWGLGTLGASWDLSEVPICRNYFHNNAETLLAFHAHALTSVQWRARGNMTFWWLIECFLSSAKF